MATAIENRYSVMIGSLSKKMLNQRQELFCINYVSGMTAKDAATQAGYNPTNTDKLLKTTSIIERLAILRAPAIVRANSAKDRKLEILENIYTHEPLPDQITARDRIHAVSEHNKMEGDYAPEKHAILGDIEITIVHRDKEG